MIFKGFAAIVLSLLGCAMVIAIVMTARDSSSAARRANTVDELAALENACGQPLHVATSARHTEDAVYPHLVFRFMRDGAEIPAWTSVGVFSRRGDDTIGRADALKAMPCVAGVHFGNNFFEKN